MNFNRLFLKLNRFICNYLSVLRSPIIEPVHVHLQLAVGRPVLPIPSLGLGKQASEQAT